MPSEQGVSRCDEHRAGGDPGVQRPLPPGLAPNQGQEDCRSESNGHGFRPRTENIAPPAQAAGGDPCGSPNAASLRMVADTIRAPALPAPSQVRHWKRTILDNIAGASVANSEARVVRSIVPQNAQVLATSRIARDVDVPRRPAMPEVRNRHILLVGEGTLEITPPASRAGGQAWAYLVVWCGVQRGRSQVCRR